MKTGKQKICIVGCGDIGKRLVRLYQSYYQIKDASILALVQSAKSVTACQQLGLETRQINLDHRSGSSALENLNFKDRQVFYFVPPPSEGEQDNRLKNFFAGIKNHPERIVLISTTGVYGDSQGKWVDENTPVKPVADRARRRLSAEQTLINWAKKYTKDYMILRVPGIYAQDRLPLARLQKGLPVVNKAEAGFTNRIHADDLAQACLLAMHCNCKNEIINITDGNPGTMTDYFNQVADFAGLPRPPQISMAQAEKTLSPGMVSYLKESRRIKNNKMLTLLGIKLKYPNLASTFKAFS